MSKIPVNCKICNVEFVKYKSEIKRTNNHFCSNKCSIFFNSQLKKIYLEKRKTDYYSSPKKCINCKNIIDFKNKIKNKYCSVRCTAIYTQKNGGHCKWSDDDKKRLAELAKNNSKFCGWNRKEKIKKECETCKKEFEVIPSLKDRNCCSRQCKNEWIKKTDYLKNKGLGGYRINSGTSKRGWYKGYFCGSSWELAWVIYNLEHDIQFKRNTDSFEYTYNGTIKKYYPDFKIDDVYIEIKGYHSKQFDAKQLQFPYKLKVLHKSELKEILKYVKDKYGKNFTYLYGK
jgi:hypothetical protein